MQEQLRDLIACVRSIYQREHSRAYREYPIPRP